MIISSARSYSCIWRSLGEGFGQIFFDSIGDTGVEYCDSLSLYTEALVKKGYRDDIEETVRKRFRNLQPSIGFSKIAEVQWKAIYTTNYDDLVEKAYSKHNYYNCVVMSCLEFQIGMGCCELGEFIIFDGRR